MSHSSKQASSSALEIVLQWVTYFFWLVTITLTSTIIGATLAYFITDTSDIDWVAYTVAPLIILLILSFFADKYYRRIEPTKKIGFSAVVMVINAVFVCLLSIGALIVSLISLTTIITDPGGVEARVVTFLTSLIVAIMTALLFARIANTAKLHVLANKYWLIMLVIVLATLFFAITGPFINKIQRRADSLIENNYSKIINEVSSYTRENKKLPDSLKDLELSDGAREAVDSGKISYKKVQEPVDMTTDDIYYRLGDTSKKAEFELCVDWDYERKGFDSSLYNGKRSYYGGAHKSGEECYEEEVLYI